MTYRLQFHEKALAEWRGLDSAVRGRLKAKLAERLEQPHVPSAQIGNGRYKIKIKAPGFRLVYEVQADCVLVLGVGPRDRIYSAVKIRS